MIAPPVPHLAQRQNFFAHLTDHMLLFVVAKLLGVRTMAFFVVVLLTDTQLHISSWKDHVFSAHKTHNYLRPEATARFAIATGEIRA